MNRTRTLVIVLAGGKGGRLELLTHERAKPAVSFAGTHRLIDFPLSNCLNSGLPDVWIVQLLERLVGDEVRPAPERQSGVGVLAQRVDQHGHPRQATR